MILIHGSSEVGDQLVEMRRHFEQRGWTVYTPTLRHHAESMPEQAELVAGVSLSDYVADLTELTRTLDMPLIGGFSFGGLVAQLVALVPRTGGCFASRRHRLRVCVLRWRRCWSSVVTSCGPSRGANLCAQ
ncbi:alpha/beta hydrolase [Mycobacterium sp. Y57]|uniref:alpha/beta hydrolase n=1 Tax=Mycolicibacterium xanthum TaxID=2796469 RepID=UPI001C841FC8|nr:alpha/beta hydrolase [Mycolicibacterium xanthum]MBX7430745.1 alpha/beta hydrolase [Mycolicibacterium xanthum]